MGWRCSQRSADSAGSRSIWLDECRGGAWAMSSDREPGSLDHVWSTIVASAADPQFADIVASELRQFEERARTAFLDADAVRYAEGFRAGLEAGRAQMIDAVLTHTPRPEREKENWQ